MLALTIALRYLLRRKVRMFTIGVLVVLGTMIIVLGETFSLSAKHFSREAIITYFTGDCIIYSARSKEKPSPFSFTTPLPILDDAATITSWLNDNPLVDKQVAITQNFGLMSVQKDGSPVEVPFVFYAVDPVDYRATFPNIDMEKGYFFSTDPAGPESGVVLSRFQVDNFSKNYRLNIDTGSAVTLLSLTDGGSVNTYASKVIGIYSPHRFVNVFNYINFIDIGTYSRLYNFTGVEASSLPKSFNDAFASTSDDAIFGLSSDNSLGVIATESLVAAKLSGYTLIAVKLKYRADLTQFMQQVTTTHPSAACVAWKDASSFFAKVAGIIQMVIYGATLLIFIIVAFILMNTLIISVLERTAEVGTLRALGGEKGFITGLFLWEAFLLNGISATVGMIISALLIAIAGRSGGVPLPDVVAQYLIGGGQLPLLFTARPFIEAVMLVFVVSVSATIYPIQVATSITPLKAMNRK